MSITSRLLVRLATTACLLTPLVTASGCAQFTLLGLLIGGPPHIEPEFDRETGESFVGTEAKVAVVCYADPKLKLRYSKVDFEVATYVARLMQINRINIAEPDYVRAWIDEHPDWETAEEVGEGVEADYVVEIELVEFDLYEPHSSTLFRGKTSGYVNTYRLTDSGEAERIFTRDVNFMFPTKVPRSTYELTEIDFKREFLSRLGEEIGFMFYPSYNGDKIPWAS
ncbi:MAG: hypothetical protein KDA75_17745 [Planctomycetaceae bacterium]|nr:hypothetical protein [Planctomycetaceae bacterium]